MRQICVVLVVSLLLLTACAGARFSSDGSAEYAYVNSFLSTMQESYNDEQLLLSFISPKFIADKHLDLADYKCNAYSMTEWDLQAYNAKTGEIVVMIYGYDDTWQHQLTFRLSLEGGKYYLIPGETDGGYIDPWYAVAENIGQEQKDFVNEFLTNMIDEYNNEPLLLTYLSPKYCDEQGISKGQFKCNAYMPESYTVGRYNPLDGTVEAFITGSEQSWTHRLVFKVVEENDKLYLWPGRHSDAYIDPWFNVESNYEE